MKPKCKLSRKTTTCALCARSPPMSSPEVWHDEAKHHLDVGHQLDPCDRSLPEIDRLANAQVGGDDHVNAAREGGHDAGHSFVWTLGGIPVGKMLVFGRRASAPFAAETEYHAFAPHLRHMLDTVDLHRFPLRFEKAGEGLAAAAPGTQTTQQFQASNPRTFTVSGQRAILRADSSKGRYLFHLASATDGSKAAWLDHYLMLEFGADDRVPTIRWFIDADAHRRVQPLLGTSWRTDERWSVRPINGGLLTPIDVAVGYEMVPRPSKASTAVKPA